MTERFVLEVDIGLSGAVAVVDATTEELVAVYDMPCLDGAGPAGRRAICAPLLAAVIMVMRRRTDVCPEAIQGLRRSPRRRRQPRPWLD